MQNTQETSRLIRMIKTKLLSLWLVLLLEILSVFIIKVNLVLFFLAIFLFSVDFKAMFLVFKENLSAKDLFKVLKPNRSITIKAIDIKEAVGIVTSSLDAEPDRYLVATFPDCVVFYRQKPFRFFRSNAYRFYYLRPAEDGGIALHTYSREIPALFKILNPALAMD